MWGEIRLLIIALSMLFCIVIGRMYYGRIPTSFQLLVLHACVAVLTDVIGTVLTKTEYRHNQALYNFYLPLDFLLMLFATRRQLGRRFRPFAITGCVVFFSVWLLSIAANGLQILATNAFICQAIFLAAAWFLVLLHNIQQPPGRETTGIYLIAISVMLYYCCIIPNFGLMHYLVRRDMKLTSRLFIINDVLNISRYFCTGLGLYLISTPDKSPKHAYE